MTEIKLTYNQLRQILGLVITNGEVRVRIGEIINGTTGIIEESDLLDLIYKSGIEKDVIHILSGKDPDTLDAIEALEYLASFFAYIRVNKPKFASWLESIGLKQVAELKTGSSQGSK